MAEGTGVTGKASSGVGAGLGGGGGASRVLKTSGGGATSKGLRKGPSSAEALRGETWHKGKEEGVCRKRGYELRKKGVVLVYDVL